MASRQIIFSIERSIFNEKILHIQEGGRLMTIPIVEIFNSIEGEGIRAGKLCTFIRTAGCNLRCSFCDTTYSYDGGRQMTVQQIIDEVKRLDCNLITLTGGEPLLHLEVKRLLIPALLDEGFEVNIETNGSIDLSQIDRYKHDKLIFTMDWKSPSSGMKSKMLEKNLYLLQPRDVLKFVVGSDEDLNEMLNIIESYAITAQIFVSPVFGKIQMSTIVDFMKQNKLHGVRLQCQLHKIAWDPNKRGV